MEHYVTLFDTLFLPQGLALHRSLERHATPYLLWVLCVDDRCAEVLSRLALPNLRALRVSELETAALKAVRPGRSIGEYCWTLTPFAPRFVFDADPRARRVTYIDADVWFRADPRQLLEGFQKSGRAVQITDHAYAPEYDQSAISGRYCVQFMTFERDAGEPIRAWWEARCLEWCYARVEEGKFGDQLYLEDWTTRFGDRVHVLHEVDRLQAPWNATRFPPGNAVAFHFHGLRLLKSNRVLLTEGYRLHTSTVETVYQPYIADVAASVDMLRRVGLDPQPQRSGAAWGFQLRAFAKRVRAAWRLAGAATVRHLITE